jgi:hypothetical protein
VRTVTGAGRLGMMTWELAFWIFGKKEIDCRVMILSGPEPTEPKASVSVRLSDRNGSGIGSDRTEGLGCRGRPVFINIITLFGNVRRRK